MTTLRIFVTAAGVEAYHVQQRDLFRSLAATDSVGEHELVGEAAEADIVLFVDPHQHPSDPSLRVIRRHPLVRRHPGKIYVYDERDHPLVSFPGIYVSGTPSLAKRYPVLGGTYPVLPTTLARDARSPDLLFSFSGARTHPIRDAVLALLHPRADLVDTTGTNFFSWFDTSHDEDALVGRERYARTVARSKFVLCPRGHGTSSFRLYETLSAGRVPVIISDRWLPPPRVDWAACAVRVPEHRVRDLPALLERLEQRWPAMAAAAAGTFDAHFSRTRLWHHYASSLAQLHPAGSPRAPWWAQRQALRLGLRHLRGGTSSLRPIRFS